VRLLGLEEKRWFEVKRPAGEVSDVNRMRTPPERIPPGGRDGRRSFDKKAKADADAHGGDHQNSSREEGVTTKHVGAVCATLASGLFACSAHGK
jgi:ABC-type nickel/cobalt efflux system permease component RcnA